MNKFFVAFAFLSLAACKSYDIKPGSERIRVFEAEPKGCIFLGEIPAEQEDTVVGPTPAEMELKLTTRVELRNKAFALNGNVIVFAKNKKAHADAAADAKKATAAPAAVGTSTPAVVEAPEERKIKTVFLATVFRCPPNIVNQ